MGSQSSSGMSGGGGSSSGNPAEQTEASDPNQSSSRGRRADRQPSADEDVDLAEVLAYLLRRSFVFVKLNYFNIRAPIGGPSAF